MRRIAVLGGGVAGVVVAQHLARKKGVAVDLIEKENRLGGLHRSIRLGDFVFDIGAFEFPRNHQLLQSFPFLYDLFVPADPISLSVTPNGEACRYPITARNYLRNNGLLHLLLVLPDMLISRFRYRKRNTVASFAKYYMGQQIYRRSGLQSYVERLYGLKDEEIGLEFALQRLEIIQDYTPIRTARRRLRAMFDKAGPISESHAMVRPRGGFEEAYREIAASLARQQVDVRVGCSIKSVARTAGGEFEIDTGSSKRKYHRVVSTIPIPVMLRLLGETPQAAFEHASLLSLFYKGAIRHDGSFLYNFTGAGAWKRITVLSSFYGAVDGAEYFTVEITTQDTSPDNLERLRMDFEAHAASVRLCSASNPIQYLGCFVTERAYPLFRSGMTHDVQSERDKLTAAGIDFVGRQGNFAYLSSRETARQAALLADAMN